jgi:DNA-binding Lrp family transcriptional regulator
MSKSHRSYVDYSSAKVLSSLCKSSNQTSEEIAKDINLGPSTVRAKTRELISSGFLKTVAVIDPSKFANVTIALVGIVLKFRKLSKSLRDISSIDEVCWAFSVTGEYDIIAQVISLEGVKGLREFIDNSLTKVGNIDTSHTWVVFNTGTSYVSLPKGIIDKLSSKKLFLELL